MSWIKWFYNKEPVVINKNLEIIKQINKIDSVNTTRVFSSDMYLKEITVLFPNIEEYIKYLKYVTACLKSNTIIKPSVMTPVAISIYYRDFFVDKNGNYINASIALSSLKECMIDFIETRKRKEEENEEDFIKEKNIYLTELTVNNLCSLVREL